MKVLLGTEFGWPGNEIAEALQKAKGVDLDVCQRELIDKNDVDLRNYDIVLIYGPHRGSTAGLQRRLLQVQAGEKRPRLIWWLNENLPPVDRPMLNMAVGMFRGAMDRLAPPVPRALGAPRKQDIMLHRYRLLHEVKSADKAKIIDCLAVTSGKRASDLKEIGIDSIVVPMGYGPSKSLGEPLNLKRDIDVLFLGKTQGKRAASRARKVAFLENELAKKEVRLSVVSHGLNGNERTERLNRTKLLLNLVRSKDDWTGHRLLLGAANGAMNVSEPMADHKPFIDGQHIAFAPLEDLPDLILHYLANETERAKVASQAYDLVTGELSMENALAKVFRSVGVALEF
ncbi:MAG: glycosyltransferase [Dinoroseobacter sp.]|nr:glycosyltransferase [Dinoroseobacter sp.]